MIYKDKKMKKILYDDNVYFVGVNGVYLELQNTRELVDKDRIKRIVVEIKDKNKIREVKEIKARYEADKEGKEYKPEMVEVLFKKNNIPTI